MPPIGYFGRLNDSELLDLINYQRTAWGNAARPVTPEDLALVRGARWKWLSMTEGLCSVYYDGQSVEYLSDNRVRVWMRTSLSPQCKSYEESIKMLKELGKGYENYEYNKDLYEIDCLKNKFRLIETSYLTSDGQAIYSFKHEGYKEGIPPSGAAKILRDIVCKKK